MAKHCFAGQKVLENGQNVPDLCHNCWIYGKSKLGLTSMYYVILYCKKLNIIFTTTLSNVSIVWIFQII